MRIAIDAMGGDHAPSEIIKGAVEAAALCPHEIILIGNEDRICQELSLPKETPPRISIVHTEEVIDNHDAPVKAVRTKRDSSMVRGLEMLKNGECDAFISAGNTGALMAGSLFTLGRIAGIDRPVIASVYPQVSGGISLIVDAGANAECKPHNLLEFGVMGSIYAQKVLDMERPRVGLVNIGAEDSKGTTIVKAAHELLQEGPVHFIGNVEARDIPAGACDIIVCDGFVGNVILKLTEGMASSMMSLLKKKFTAGLIPKMGAALLSGKFKEIKELFDYSEYGGAPILGVRGAVIKIHGSSKSKAVKNAILKAVPYVENNVVSKIQDAVIEIAEIDC